MQKILIGVIILIAAFLAILAFNHQFIESLLAYSQRTGTVDKFRHDNENNNPPQDSGNARH